MGSSVCFRAELIAVNNRRIQFSVNASMGEKIIGGGTHERAIIDVRRFKERVEAQ
jgi:predicted thioesterase